MTERIEGLKLEVPGQEVHDHLRRRAEYHRAKAEWYAGQVESLQSGGVRPTGVSNDPLQSLEQSQQEHRAKAELFAFMADHVVRSATYRLSEQDLARIEIISRYV